MKLKYLAHAAFLLESAKGTKILTDPYASGASPDAIGYQPIEEQVNAITTSHKHADHGYIAPWHSNTRVLDQAEQFSVEDIKIFGIETFHDAKQGKERGPNIIFVFKIDGLSICHLGDLGHMLTSEQVALLGEIDVLLIPVGGVYTIDAKQATEVISSLAPKICIPMHYKTEKLIFDLAPVDDFIKDKNNVKNLNVSCVTLEVGQLPEATEIWVLKPAKL